MCLPVSSRAAAITRDDAASRERPDAVGPFRLVVVVAFEFVCVLGALVDVGWAGHDGIDGGMRMGG